jgi:hypothetical protein
VLVGCWCGTVATLFAITTGYRKPEQCTCTVCRKQPLSQKSAGSKVFRLLHNLNIFCVDQNTTYDQYVYATRYGYNLPINRLVPATFPGSLSFQLSWTSH